jgi:hypothetical protein
MAKLTKIDSNVTGLRYAEEESYKVLSTSPTPEWVPLEPNSYADFGGNVTTVARNPINPSRQRKKGVVTDLDASGGFNTDLTQENLQNLLQGFFFADLRRKADVGVGRAPFGNGNTGEDLDYLITDIDTTADTITVDSRVAVTAAVVVGGTGYAEGDIVQVTDANATVNARFVVATAPAGVVATVALLHTHSVSGVIYYGTEGRTHTDTGVGAATTKVTGSGDDALTLTVTYGNGLTWQTGDIIKLAGNNDAANDGLMNVASAADNVITTTENLTTDAAPAATATMTTVGYLAVADDLNVVVSGALPTITSDAAFDFTTLGLIPGEWIFVGGDTAATQFVNSENNGFKRIRSVSATAITFDKSASTMVAETLSGGETVQLFFGRVLKNETGTLIKRRTYNLERTLGAPNDSTPTDVQAEYITGAVPNEANFGIPSADKLTADLAFVGADNETKDGPTTLKTGNRPALVEADAFNTSSDFSRIKLAQVVPGDEAPTALFAFAQELSLNINNNVTPNKAVGVLGAFEVTAGTFEVGGSITAYFADVDAVQAIRDNADITLDLHLVKANAGISIDVPLITLGDGRPNVEQDQAITLPLSSEASTGAKIDPDLDHTLLLVFFDYLPDAADV